MPRLYIPEINADVEFPEGHDPAKVKAEVLKEYGQASPPETIEVPSFETTTPITPQQEVKPQKPEASGVDKAMALITGVGQSMPQTQMANALAKPLIKLLGGEGLVSEQMEGKAPGYGKVGRIAGEIAQYAAGSAGLKGIGAAGKFGLGFLGKSGLLPTILRGALTNVAVQQGQDFDLDPQRMAIDAAFGGGGEMLGAGIGAVGKSKALRGVARKWMESAFPKGVLNKIRGTKLYDVIGEMMERRIGGTPEKIQGKSQQMVDFLEDQIDEIIEAHKDLPAPKGKIVDRLNALADDLAREESRIGEARKVRGLAEQYWKQGKTTLGDIQESKRRLYRLNKPVLEKGKMNLDLKPARTKYELEKAAGQKELIEDLLAEQGIDIGVLNKEQGLFLTLRDLMEDVAKAEAGKSAKIGIKDLMYAGGGGLVGGGGGAVAAPIASRLLGGFAGRTQTALAIQKLLNAMIKGGKAARLSGPIASSIAHTREENR